MYRIKSIELRFIFIILIFINCLWGLMPLYRGSILLKFFNTPTDFINSFGGVFLFLNFGLMLLGIFVHCIYYPKLNRSRLLLFIIIFLFYLISIALNSFKSGFFSIIGIPVFYLFVFFVLDYYYLPIIIEKYLRWIFVLWAFIPVILVILTKSTINNYFYTLNYNRLYAFAGFAMHQNVYGYFAGLAVLIAIFGFTFNKWTMLFIPFILIGINLAETRSTLLATIICSIYYIFNQDKYIDNLLPNLKRKKISQIEVKTLAEKKIFKVIISILVLLIFLGIVFYWLKFGSRGKFLLGVSDRVFIYKSFFSFISDHPLFGFGGEYLVSSIFNPEGVPAHNFIVQGTANFGIIVTIFSLFFIFIYWKYSKLHSRCLLLYMIIFGLFQPYFNCFGLISNYSLAAFFLGTYYDSIFYN